MEALIDRFGEDTMMFACAMAVGLLFGFAAARSEFCLRAATVEFSGRTVGPRLIIWLIAFFSALFCVQSAIYLGILDVSTARQLAATGSISGAVLGGLLFGAGMILARGCASRLLVLSASGNLRAIISGLVLTLTAQASLRGILAPARESAAALWTIEGGTARSLLPTDAGAQALVIFLAGGILIAAGAFGLKRGVTPVALFCAALVGVAVYAGWQATYAIARSSFEIVPVQSVTFTGPSTDTLMALVNEREVPAGFGMGLVLGVFLGAMATAIVRGQARIQRFEPDVPMERYLVGGVLMGFGSMLAGGCAVGAGLSGGSILALTAWIAVFCMWVGAVTTTWILQAGAAPRMA